MGGGTNEDSGRIIGSGEDLVSSRAALTSRSVRVLILSLEFVEEYAERSVLENKLGILVV